MTAQDGPAPSRTGQDQVDGTREDGSGDGLPATADQPGDGARQEIEHPAKLLRLATMAQALLNEVATVQMDEAGRSRLASIHNETIEELRQLVSEDLRSELDALELEPVGDGVPTGGELRVVQAQLTGWLQGLFQGIQASVASQQMAAQQQLARMQQQGELGPGSSGSRSGQYL